MGFFGDYHTHTHYSESKSTVEDNVAMARVAGLSEIAITDHGFGNPRGLSLSRKQYPEQREEIKRAREANPDFSIIHGIEADIVSLDGDLDMSIEEFKLFDIVIMGWHSFAKPKSFRDYRKMYFYGHLGLITQSKFRPPKHVIERNTRAYIEAIKKYPIDVIAHINNYVIVDEIEVAKACADYGTYLELNCKHIRQNLDNIQGLIDTGVKFVAGSDAHVASDVGNFKNVVDFLTENGISLDILENYNTQPKFKNLS